MATSTDELDRTASRAGTLGTPRKKSNPKLVGRLLRLPSATEKLPDGWPARMQRSEVVAAVNKIMAELFPGIDLAIINGGFIDEKEFGRYERGEVFWPSQYRRAAFRRFFGVADDAALGFYHQRRLEPVLDDREPVDPDADTTTAVTPHAGEPVAPDRPHPQPRTAPETAPAAPGTGMKAESDGSPLRRSSALDLSTANAARRYDYWLGGKDHFAADRASGDAIAQRFPWVPRAAAANRAFLGRAVEAVASEGVRQFLDIGAGLPAPGSVHEAAQRVASDVRVLYVDNDPLVGVHARALTIGATLGHTAYLEADLRRPEQILEHPECARALDLREPVGIVLAAVLHYVSDLAVAQRAVRTLLDAAAPGSFLILSHGTTDFMPADEAAAYEQMYASGVLDARTRTKADITRFFDGLQIMDPGLVAVSRWRPIEPSAPCLPPEQAGIYGAVGRLP